MTDSIKGKGIFVSGEVSESGSYTSKKSGAEYYHVVIYAPGSELIRVGLPGRPDPKRFIVGEPVKLQVNLGKFGLNEAV